jgi:hypothetical protein
MPKLFAVLMAAEVKTPLLAVLVPNTLVVGATKLTVLPMRTPWDEAELLVLLPLNTIWPLASLAVMVRLVVLLARCRSLPDRLSVI